MRLSVCIAAALLAGCAQNEVTTVSREPTDYFTLHDEHSTITNLAISDWQFINRRIESDIPIYPRGTEYERVMAALRESGCAILWDRYGQVLAYEPTAEPDVDVASKRRLFLYVFRNGKLHWGPSSFSETLRDTTGIEDNPEQQLGLLELFIVNDAATPADYNLYAWVLSTHSYSSMRNARKALAYARLANEQTEWSDHSYVDTMAAAFAVAGDFASAVEMQERAIALADQPDPGYAERLAKYREGEIWLEYFPGGPDHIPEPQYPELLAAAEAGDADARYLLAENLINTDSPGPGNPPWFDKALAWLEIAANDGSTAAQNEMGINYIDGRWDKERDLQQARFWLDQAVADNSAFAAYNIARLYDADGLQETPSDVERSHWLDKAAAWGMPEAMFEMAFRYGEGVGVERDRAVMRDYLQRVQAEGFSSAQFLAADTNFYVDPEYSTGVIVDYMARLAPDPRELPGELLRLVDQVEAALKRGDKFVVFDFGETAPAFLIENAATLIHYLTRVAAFLGHREAQDRLASHFELGYGVTASEELAAYWRQRAARNPLRLP